VVASYVPPSKARRLWALPGAMFTGMARPEYVNGRMMRTPQSAIIDMPCPSFLIEHERGLLLFDTGVSPRGLADPDHYFPGLVQQFGFECRPELGVDAQIRQLGYRLEDIRYVIRPPALRSCRRPLPVPERHLHHWRRRDGLRLSPRRRVPALLPDGGPSPTRDFRWIETGHDFDLFGDGSVQLLFSPGHTPGSLALFVRLPNRNLILTGDTCHYRNEVEHGVADALHDQVTGIASLQRLILMRDAWDARIWIGHDI
jgi:hypothetical protein